MKRSEQIHKLLDETVRRERGWLISSLVARLGPAQVDLAQDVAQDAIVKALSTWTYKGIPDNPRAWLRRVAGNAAIDRIRRSARELGIEENWQFTAPDNDVITPSLSDPELDLMVLCCDPELSKEDQLILALKTVCGFTAIETGALLFLSEDALSQRLARAKRKLRAQSGELARFPTRFALKERLPQILRIIYLMFSWGYLPRRGTNIVREDLCREAIRLSEGLMAHAVDTTPGHHALHALLLFQTARLPARFSPKGQLLTLEQQDRSLWSGEMLSDALEQLSAAQASPTLTRYHFEAGIAALHAQAGTWQETNWPSISRLYALLEQHITSPAITVNHAVSLLMQDELDDAEALLATVETKVAKTMTGWHLAQSRLASARGDQPSSNSALQAARACLNAIPVAEHIDRQIQLIDSQT